MFLLVPAYPGCPGSKAVKRSLCCCCCRARSMLTFPAAGHHRPLTGTKLYCWRQRHMLQTTCQKSLPKIRKAGTGTHDLLSRKSNALAITPTGHTNTVLTKKYLFLPADNYIIKTRCCHTYRLDSILKVFYGLFHTSSVSQLCLCSNLHVQRQVYAHCSATYIR